MKQGGAEQVVPGEAKSSTREGVGGLEVAEIGLVLVKTPKLRLVPWGCGSWARTVALGSTYRSVGLLQKAT